MKTTKKSQIEISFNWIFVLIAGAVILFFFIKIINSELDLGLRVSTSKAVSNMNVLMSTLQQSPDSISVQQRVSYEINFKCDIEGHTFKIKDSGSNLPNQAIFAPETIGDSRLITWIRTFKVPYDLTSTLYFTDEKTRYVFLNDSDNDKKVKYYYDLFPENISKEYITLTEFQNKGDQGHRQYILIINQEASDTNFGFEDIRLAKKIKYVIAVNYTNKKINFYKFQDRAYLTNPVSKDYFTDESIIGAMISGNPELYECAMNKILEQIRITADINEERIKSIANAYPLTHSCQNFYSIISQTYFSDLSTASENKEYNNLTSNYNYIKSLNERIIRAGCTALY